MKKVKSIFRYIFTIILTITLIAYFVINILSSTIMNKSFVLSKLDETGYYDKILGYAQENFENYLVQSGLDKSVLENIITREDVVEDTQKVLNNIYSNIEENINAENLKTKLNANIENATKNMGLSDAQKASLKEFVDEIAKDYLNSIAHFDFEKTIFNAYHRFSFILDVANKAVLIFIGVAIFGLAVTCGRRIYRFFSSVGIVLFATGLFFIIVNIFVNIKVNIQTITLLNDAFSFTLREILDTIFGKVLGTGLLTFFGGLVLIIVSNLAHNFFKYRYYVEEEENVKNKRQPKVKKNKKIANKKEEKITDKEKAVKDKVKKETKKELDIKKSEENK